MSDEQARKIIRILEAVKSRPEMYVGKRDDPKEIQTFLWGIHVICRTLTGVDYDFFREIALKRGWKNSPVGIVPSMREAGLSDEEIVTELITIDIEAYKQIFKLESLNLNN